MADRLFLFGGDKKWNPAQWQSSNDTVRGGKSSSFLTALHNHESIQFSGTLDTTALGVAGFASQRTIDALTWDLSAYEGLIVNIGDIDDKKYTITFKDDAAPPKRDDGREQSSVSWEYSFDRSSRESLVGAAAKKGGDWEIVVPFSAFEATYRGKPVMDAKPVDLSKVNRFSLLMRSFFTQQSGPYELVVNSIAATNTISAARESSDSVADAKGVQPETKHKQISKTTCSWLCSCFGK